MVGVGLLLLIVGTFATFWPRSVWNSSRWAYRHPEAVAPSDAYFTFVRVVGVAAILFALFVVFIPAYQS